uniref:Ras-related protein Rab n=1 Tax=Oryzias latipes TaxID=8090 RepID=H2M510_ORYLA
MMTKLFSSVGPGQAAPTSRGSLTGGCCATHTVPPWKRISHKEGPTPLSSTSPRGSGRSCLFSSAPRSPVLLAPSSPESFPPQWIHAQLSPSSSVAMQNNHHKERLYKILVIGDLGVGKTSIIKRYVHHNFSPNYRATIGVDFALKVLNWEQETVRLQLWDIAGQERFGNMTRVYYREAMGAFIVFDVTRPASFEAVTKWKEDLDSKVTLSNGKHVATVLLANKCDQGQDVLTNNGIKMDQFCQENGFVGWFETSAKAAGILDSLTQQPIILPGCHYRMRSILQVSCTSGALSS